jgi:probable HAF family extracellular repeat protein
MPGRSSGFFFPNTAGIEGFLDTRGSFTQIHVPGAITDAFGINDAGQIVGGFTDTTGPTHGFLDTRGSFTQIDVPGLTPGAQTFTVAFGINDA